MSVPDTAFSSLPPDSCLSPAATGAGYQSSADWRQLAVLCRRSDSGLVLNATGSQMQLAFLRERYAGHRRMAGFNVTLDTGQSACVLFHKTL